MEQKSQSCPPEVSLALSCCSSSTPAWSLQGQEIWAKCVSVYDGDTVRLAFSPHPACSPRVFACRLAGYNAAEVKSKDPAEKAAALLARDHLRSLVLDKIVRVSLGSFDKYGRILVKIYTDFDVSAHMIESGYGRPYDGTGEKNWC